MLDLATYKQYAYCHRKIGKEIQPDKSAVQNNVNEPCYIFKFTNNQTKIISKIMMKQVLCKKEKTKAWQ